VYDAGLSTLVVDVTKNKCAGADMTYRIRKPKSGN
jgi:hypothetical protein